MSVAWTTLPNGQVDIAGEGVPLPPPDYEKRLRRVADRWLPLAEKHAARTGVPLAWILAFISVESAGDPKAVSPAGATGLMQLMPMWWHGRTREQMFDPDTNMTEGTDLLRILRGSSGTGGELPKVASVYNCGADTGANAPRLRPGTRWGMCAEGKYIDEVVREQNLARVLWSEPSADVGLGVKFLLSCWGVLKLAGVRWPW